MYITNKILKDQIYQRYFCIQPNTAALDIDILGYSHDVKGYFCKLKVWLHIQIQWSNKVTYIWQQLPLILHVHWFHSCNIFQHT